MQVHHIEGGTSRKCCPPRLTAATIFTGETDLQAVWSFEQGQSNIKNSDGHCTERPIKVLILHFLTTRPTDGDLPEHRGKIYISAVN